MLRESIKQLNTKQITRIKSNSKQKYVTSYMFSFFHNSKHTTQNVALFAAKTFTKNKSERQPSLTCF